LTELEKVAFRNVVKIKLRRNKHKEQINEELSIEEKNFIYLLFDSGQKKRYPDFKDDRG
jgi:predicted double-glycine peptidase